MGKPRFSSWVSCAEKLAGIVHASGNSLREKMESLHELTYTNRTDPRCALVAQALTEDEVIHATIDAECTWDSMGRPYYKIWPNMCQCMSHCSIDIPASSLLSPFPVIEVRLPSTELPADVASSVLVATANRSQLVKARKRSGEDVRTTMRKLIGDRNMKTVVNDTFNAWYRSLKELEDKWGELVLHIEVYYQTQDDRRHSRYTLEVVEAHEGNSIDDALSQWATLDAPATGGVGDADFTRLLKIIVATMFFAIDRHEVIMPDVQRDIIEARFPKRRGKLGDRLQEQRVQREIEKHKGWRVGSEISLPRPVELKGDHLREVGAKLSYSHMRSGHMRMQPCGKGNKDRKLIFLAPTFIRPDLPLRPSSGYRIASHADVGLSRGA